MIVNDTLYCQEEYAKRLIVIGIVSGRRRREPPFWRTSPWTYEEGRIIRDSVWRQLTGGRE